MVFCFFGFFFIVCNREWDDGQFTPKKKGVKRKRIKDEPADIPTSDTQK